MFKIYGMHTPMFLKAVLAAEEMGVNYEIVPVDLTKGETRTPEHKARHPFGKVPVLEHEGRFVFESNAILRYMANVTKSPLYPAEPFARAVVDQWMDYFTIQAGRWVTSVWFERYIAPTFFKRETDQKLVSDQLTYLLDAMPTVDAHLAKNKYLAGSELSLADLNAYMLTQGWRQADIALGDFPNFVRWFDEIAARESVKRTWAKDA